MKFFSKYFSLSVAAISFVLSSSFSHADQVTVGSTVMLSVTADGTSPFTYQWKKDGVNLVGSTAPTLTISNIQNMNAGSYSVLVANAAGSTTSDISTLAIVVPTVITMQPVSQSVTVGSAVTFTSAATGLPAPTFQWKKNGVSISGATGATLTLNNVAAAAAGTYTVVATNSINSVTSAGAVLTVNTSQASALGNSLVYGATNFPMSASAGSAVNFTFNVTNSGKKTWGSNHYLALLDSGFKVIDFGNLNGTVAGSEMMVSLNFTAPTTAGTYRYLVQPLENGVEWFGTQLTLILTVKAPPISALGNSMVYGANDFPMTVDAGSAVNFTYNVTNTGKKLWGSNHYLALLDSSFNLIDFGDLDGTVVGSSKTVSLNFTAPTTAGTYRYLVQPLENGVEWFGNQQTLILTVKAPQISALGNSMVYGATDFPVTVDAGSAVKFTYKVKNTGNKAWGSNHYLALLDSAFNLIDFGDLNGTVVGSSKTVSLNFTAPTTAGTYRYVVRPLENGVEWFGTQLTLTLTVKAPEVSAIGNSMVYGVNNFPMSVSAGSAVNFTYNVKNTGTKAWGSNHYLALLDAAFNLIDFGDLNGTVVGSSKAVSLNFTAPTTAGTYRYVVRPLENGVEWFGTQLTLTLTVY